jgi:UDP-N-acetylmuramoyl-L-alanyl-D-glutamate--2,6-diaminopimelate ligase
LVSQCDTVSGRLECFTQTGMPAVFVDFAHTPDALKQALLALRGHFTGKVYCLFGCGGDRDQGKRPLMGKIARQYADDIIITDDNPRSEDGDEIIKDILSGISNTEGVTVERDRKNAIRLIIEMANSSDTVLIAGKGHEEFQMIGDQKFKFSDRNIVRACMS